MTTNNFFKQFISDVVSFMQNHVEKGYQIKVVNIDKNNGVRYHGLMVVNPLTNITPTIYLEPYFDKFLNGMDFESICSHILRTYEENKPKADFNTSNFMDFDIMKKSLVMRLVNMKQNESLLQKVPYLKFLDLAVVFQYVVTEIGDEYATILVHNVHMKLWNVTVDDLYKIAMENTPKLLPYNLMNIESIFRELINIESDFCEDMFILTNRLRIYGATSVLYPEILEVIKEKVGDDKWIMIPSSVHEWLILPEKDFGYMKNKEDLQMFITSVNEAEIKEEEILSNHAYHFNGKELVILE